MKAFAAGAPFAAATVDELVNESNPFRRPVRPDDLDFLDYTAELPAADAGSLSGLLGHRMLLNAYETDLVFLPQADPSPSWTDSRSFYSPESRLLADLARPVLEHHLFSHLDDPAEDSPCEAASIVDQAIAEHERLAETDLTGHAIRDLVDPRSGSVLLLLQVSATAASRAAALGRCALGDDARAIDVTGAFLAAFVEERSRLPQLDRLLLDADLSVGPRAYWQFYLGSTLACTTHLHRVCRDHARLFEAIGALVHHTAVQPVLAEQRRELIGQTVGANVEYFDPPSGAPRSLRTQIEAIVAGPLDRYGSAFAEGCRRGFDAARRLAATAENDFITQISWADRLDANKARGQAIRQHLHDEQIEVDLDTFVEGCEVTSTTHVHDDHRLVVIERGEMHFWNNAGPKIPLATGDAILIPKGRLHGSTVLSGECTYHQPIIPDEILEAVR
ncbi:MAG TPA: cupin domain-containing protein [Solirubrobacteraceae bacterium]|nr:cupin domain-containing protein [Solirubrobacteraceae bacterium]